ncbi:MAG TPA: hypothetical protein VMU07_02935, partial [Candidatus Paceibacterota bacterium]|nr:hypothetical protein [Candidatus Paceibacterota bacterium]
MKIAYYTIMVLAMVGCLVTVFVINVDAPESVEKFPQLSPVARDAEYAKLAAIVAQPAENGHQYFDVLYRIYGLQQSCKRADREEHGESEQRARWMVLQTEQLARDWFQASTKIDHGDEFIQA